LPEILLTVFVRQSKPGHQCNAVAPPHPFLRLVGCTTGSPVSPTEDAGEGPSGFGGITGKRHPRCNSSRIHERILAEFMIKFKDMHPVTAFTPSGALSTIAVLLGAAELSIHVPFRPHQRMEY
jgi:hypothetical protein